ncbi:MAG TPA: divalent-cation tolerance protein CutA [Labilithrix sp.]|jgi:periplasmic divalent cation tolerance protein|nr:divalent-cation tolerance protein CutA [Labilithrix sp.]
MKHIAVITTVGNIDDARRIARDLVERRLVACAHISEIESVYVWKGALENDKEFRVLLKTTAARYDEVERAIKATHPYELPAIYATSLERVYAPYAEWLEANSSTGS